MRGGEGRRSEKTAMFTVDRVFSGARDREGVETSVARAFSPKQHHSLLFEV